MSAPTRFKRRALHPTNAEIADQRPSLLESLEPRWLMASLGDVQSLLLPLFMGGFGEDTLSEGVDIPNANLPASDAWWALRSQRNMAINEQESDVLHLASHNGFNASGEGFKIASILGFGVSPNHLLSITNQLEIGSRLIELDIHDERIDGEDGQLVLKHGDPPFDASRSTPFRVESALNKIRDWMDRPENLHEIVYIDIEDRTEDPEDDLDDETEDLIPMLTEAFGSMIYTPAERRVDGSWPSRLELTQREKRIVIFTHRNDSGDGRFGPPVRHVDPNGHSWFGAGIAFRRDGSEDFFVDGTSITNDRGVFNGDGLNDINSNGYREPDTNVFYAMQSDALRAPAGPQPPATANDFRNAAVNNVNFVQVDFLFTHDEDDDLGNDFVNDDIFQITEGNRPARLEALVWSWANGDPAVDRQIFQDFIPGDGVGQAQQHQFSAEFGQLFFPITQVSGLTDRDLAPELRNRGKDARRNGLDYAIQLGLGGFDDGGPSRWRSVDENGFGELVTPPNFLMPDGVFTFRPPDEGMPFALRSTERNNEGHFEWRVSDFKGMSIHDAADIPDADLNPGGGFTYEFAAPANGFENQRLLSERLFAPVWINANDADRDGNWAINDQDPIAEIVTTSDEVFIGTSLVLDADAKRVRSERGETLFNFSGSSDPDGDDLFFHVTVVQFDTIAGDRVGIRTFTLEDGEAISLDPAFEYELRVTAADGRGAINTATAPFDLVDPPLQPFAISDAAKLFGTLDGETGAFAPIGPIQNAAGTVTFENVENLAANPRTGLIYGIEGGNSLLMIDPTTAIATVVGDPMLNDVDALTINPLTEQMFAVDATLATNPGTLYTIDLMTGEATEIAPLTFAGTDPMAGSDAIDPKIDGIAFDPTTGTLFGAYSSWGDPSFIVEIDPTTGVMTNIGPAGVDDVEDIAFTPDGVLVGVLGDTGAFGDDALGSFEGLVTIDTTTGAASPIGLFGEPLAERGWDMEGLAFGSLLPAPITASMDQILQKSFAAPALFGDRNDNGDVDAADLFLFRQAYANSLVDTGYDVRFDRDIDGDVDEIDLEQFRENFEKVADTVFDAIDGQGLTEDGDQAGDTPAQALDLGVLAGSLSGAAFIGGSDTNDYYKFNVTEAVSFRAALSSSVGGVKLSLLNSNQQLIGSIDVDAFGVFETEIAGGEYFLVIDAGGVASPYYLELGAV